GRQLRLSAYNDAETAMFTSVSEFALVIAVACLVAGVLLARYRWARRVAAIVVVAHIATLIGGPNAGVAVLIAGIAVWCIAAAVQRHNPSRTITQATSKSTQP
ncbi:MAG: hypothetical protein AAGF31_07230, partial [Planctomycetota bacterium]